MIAALYVETDGCYFDVQGVDPWDKNRDARKYTGPHPVVAHPPCPRWGKFWHGSPRKPFQFNLGEDEGCFGAALTSVRNHTGVLEHPAHSQAFTYFGLETPPNSGGWIKADSFGGFVCQVEQCHYGHVARKKTYLYACGVPLPELNWSAGEQRLHQPTVEKYGYEYARRQGIISMIGGKDKVRLREATPILFRDLLISIARGHAGL